MRFAIASQAILAATAANGLAISSIPETVTDAAGQPGALPLSSLAHTMMKPVSLAVAKAAFEQDKSDHGGSTDGPQPEDDEGTTSTAALGDDDDETTTGGAGAAQPSATPSGVPASNLGNSTSSTAATCSSYNRRTEWRNLSDQQKMRFLNAVSCVKKNPSLHRSESQKQQQWTRWDDLVAVHQQLTDKIHMSGIFLVWHRYYTWVYSELLRTECGYDGPLPWWDELKDAGHFQQAPLFTDRYFGKCDPAGPGGKPNCITTGAFAGDTLHVGPGSGGLDHDIPHCLSRAVDESQTAQITQQYVDSCMRTEYSDMEGCIELGPHAYGHNGVGSVMAEVAASPGDPVFFMHHGFVDRMFQKWQEVNPRVRTTTINGCATPGNNCTPLTLDTTLTSNGFHADLKVRDVLNIGTTPLCYSYDY